MSCVQMGAGSLNRQNESCAGVTTQTMRKKLSTGQHRLAMNTIIAGTGTIENESSAYTASGAPWTINRNLSVFNAASYLMTLSLGIPILTRPPRER